MSRASRFKLALILTLASGNVVLWAAYLISTPVNVSGLTGGVAAISAGGAHV